MEETIPITPMWVKDLEGEFEPRFKALVLSAHMLVELCKPGEPAYAQVIENALPADTRYVRLLVFDPGPRIGALLYSDTFPLLEPQERIPLLPDVVFRRVTCSDKGGTT